MMRLSGTPYVIATAVAVGLVIHARPARSADVIVSPERVVPSERVAESVALRDVRVEGDVVSGVLTNRSDKVLRDVQLLIQYDWLWKNEFRPGEDNPGRAVYHTVPRRAAVRLPLPFMDAAGVPPPLVVVDANRNGRLDRGEVRRTRGGLGFRADLDKTARNLAVPGEDTGSVFEKISAEDVAGELV